MGSYKWLKKRATSSKKWRFLPIARHMGRPGAETMVSASNIYMLQSPLDFSNNGYSIRSDTSGEMIRYTVQTGVGFI